MSTREILTLRRSALFGVSVAALCCSYANAQTAAGAPNATARPSEVAEVVVTAERREERLVDVPIAIAHVSGPQLQQAGVTDFANLQQIMPGVMISRTGAYSQPSVRGISSSTAGPGSSNNVATYIDGIYHPFLATLFLDTEGVASIDVLKGPQGTLFGRNATGGAILITTPEPTATPQGRVAAQYGRFNDAMIYGQYTGPISDTLGFMVSGYGRRSDGYLRDIGGFNTAPVKNAMFNAKLLWKPTDKLSVEFLFENKQNGDPTPLTFNYLQYQAIRKVNPNVIISTTPFVTSLPRRTLYSDNLTTYALKVRYDTPYGYFSNSLSYMFDHNHARYNAGGGTPAVSNETEYKQHSHATQEELNFNSHPGQKVDYVLGLYFYDGFEGWKYADIISGAQSVAQAPGHVYSNGRPAEASRSAAAYADATWHVTDALHLSAGLRYSTEKVTVWNVTTGGASTRFNATTPRLVARYDLDGHSNIYASYSKGFKAGAYNFAVVSTLINPEHLTAYEVGYKAARGMYRFDAALFYYDYRDLQVTALTPNPITGAVENRTTNAARAKDYGAEVQFEVEPVERLHLRLSGAYTHATYDSYTTFSPALPNTVLVNGLQYQGAGLGGPLNPSETDLSGQQLTRAPTWAASGSVAYTWLLSRGAVTANTNVSWQSRYAPTAPDWELGAVVGPDRLIQPSGHGQRLSNPAYALWNAKVTWNITEQTSIGAYVNNITDETYFTTLNSTTSGVYGQWGAPRTYGLRFDHSF
jgi:iron complex outermembrane receptor protein